MSAPASRPRRAQWIVCAAILATPCAVEAAGEEAKLAVVKPGGGILAADGISVVPLHVVVEKRGKSTIRSARVTASVGKVAQVKVLDGEHVSFLYTPPKRSAPAQETLEVTLDLDDGERSETFPFELRPPAEPELSLAVEPGVVELVDRKKQVAISARVEGTDAHGVAIAAAPGSLGEVKERTLPAAMTAAGSLDASVIPADAPAYILVLAATSTDRGIAATTKGAVTEAPIRISVEIPPRSVLEIEGAASEPEPVTAPADGRTVVDGVVVRYGARVRAFSTRAGKRSEVSLALPSSASPAVFLAIPGQAFADGGTGPTVVVAAPPPPFGGEPIWPEITIEGITIVQTIKLSPGLRVLVLQRPAEPTSAAVLFDEEAVGRLELLPRHGESVSVAPAHARSEERGAVELLVKDGAGELTDVPVPRARIPGGASLELLRQGPGRYRAAIPSSVPGDAGTMIEIVAEIDPPPVVSGDALSQIGSSIRLPLKGASVVRAGGLTPKEEASATPKRTEPTSGEDGLRFGVSASLLVGTTFNSLLVVGGAILAELRPPLLDGRLAIRAGLELSHASGSGTVGGFAGAAPESRATIAGVLLPIDVGFAIVHEPDFELLARAGLALRLESGVVEVGGVTPGGGDRTGLGAHVSVEAAFGVGTGALVLGATLGGIGASADGLSSAGTQLTGALTNVRADAGYRIWF